MFVIAALLFASLAAADKWHPSHTSLRRARDCAPPPATSNEPDARMWLQTCWEPYVGCSDEERVGPIGDGGKWICNPVRDIVKNDCVVVSVGSNNDFRFEEEMVERFGCTVHVFRCARVRLQVQPKDVVP